MDNVCSVTVTPYYVDMTYYSKRQQWGYYITTTADNEKVTIDADAKEYNKTTRTDYADEKTLHFDANDRKLSQASASTGINIAKAGTYTIIVAADGKGYLTYSVVEDAPMRSNLQD